MTIMKKPRSMPIIGARTMNTNVFVQPERTMAPKPDFATAAPA
jgi:hypothetical protein